MGPHRQNNRLTLNQRKKPQSQAAEPGNKEEKEIIIEDCQVPVDNTSYADWLLEQGIDMNVDIQNRSNADNTEITQIPEQIKDIANQGTVEQAASVVPIPDSTDNKGFFDPNRMVQEYMAKFQADLNAYLISSQSEEDTMDRINRVSNALCNMGADPSILDLSLKSKLEKLKIYIKRMLISLIYRTTRMTTTLSRHFSLR